MKKTGNPYEPIAGQTTYQVEIFPQRKKYTLATELDFETFQTAMESFFEREAQEGFRYRVNGMTESALAYEAEYLIYIQRIEAMISTGYAVTVDIRLVDEVHSYVDW